MASVENVVFDIDDVTNSGNFLPKWLVFARIVFHSIIGFRNEVTLLSHR